PTIVVTIIADEGVGAGFAIHDFLCKPIVPEELLGSLERAHVWPGEADAVLVVDDDPASLKLMEVTLAQGGYQPICAADGEAGLQLVGERDISAVVLDLMMPNVDGFEFLRRFIQLDKHHHVPVIVWTNKDLTREDYAQLQTSARAVLQKHEGGTSALMEEIQACLSPHVVMHHREA
ncbi:MAG TPA: response regulator, partial [Ktedonobacterales bacterium]|nr:response regulator [Ktedonobacterales bacterium]